MTLFGFEKFDVKLDLRPIERIGSDDVWNKSELMLKNALSKSNINYEILNNEGAFYGPKIEFHLEDSLKRNWQCGTIQLDFSMPLKFQSFYINEMNSKEVPVLLHRAILGSFERFIGILIEHYNGKLPLC